MASRSSSSSDSSSWPTPPADPTPTPPADPSSWPTPPADPRAKAVIDDIWTSLFDKKQKTKKQNDVQNQKNVENSTKEDAAGEGLVKLSKSEEATSDEHTMGHNRFLKWTRNSPIVVALIFMLTLSSWSKLIPFKPPHMLALELTGLSFDEFTAVDRYQESSLLFTKLIHELGVFGEGLETAAIGTKSVIGIAEFVIAFNLTIAVTYDHHILGCMAAAILHLVLLSLMLVLEDGSVFFTESIAIQLLAGSLVLLGLKQEIPFEERAPTLVQHKKQSEPSQVAADVLERQSKRKQRVEDARLRQRNKVFK